MCNLLFIYLLFSNHSTLPECHESRDLTHLSRDSSHMWTTYTLLLRSGYAPWFMGAVSRSMCAMAGNYASQAIQMNYT